VSIIAHQFFFHAILGNLLRVENYYYPLLAYKLQIFCDDDGFTRECNGDGNFKIFPKYFFTEILGILSICWVDF
jgi:hypothetical protein